MGFEKYCKFKTGRKTMSSKEHPSAALPGHIVPQGISADLIASKYGFSRKDVDEYAYHSLIK